MERPDLLELLAEKHGARDTTARQQAFAELATMQPHPSQYDPGHEIPERSWAYRLAKRWWFNDYGTYSRQFDADDWHDTRQPATPNGSDTQPSCVGQGGVKDLS